MCRRQRTHHGLRAASARKARAPAAPPLRGFGAAQKLIQSHLSEGVMRPGAPISLKMDQTLTQDATGTLAMLSLESLGLDRARTEVSVQYVDHNLLQLQIDNRNADDHLFLESACRRFGIWYSPPGNGISHVVHMQRFGKPGKSLLGSDSHTPAAGSLGMLAIGAGGLDVALAISGEPFPTTMPRIFGVKLVGELAHWVSAKDVILELLRRHGVAGGQLLCTLRTLMDRTWCQASQRVAPSDDSHLPLESVTSQSSQFDAQHTSTLSNYLK